MSTSLQYFLKVSKWKREGMARGKLSLEMIRAELPYSAGSRQIEVVETETVVGNDPTRAT